MLYSYEKVDNWIESISYLLKKEQIDIILGLQLNGIFPALSVSKHLNKSMIVLNSFQGQLYLPHTLEIKELIKNTQNNSKALFCLDSINMLEQSNILAVQKFLTDFNINYKILTISNEAGSKIKPDFLFNTPIFENNLGVRSFF